MARTLSRSRSGHRVATLVISGILLLLLSALALAMAAGFFDRDPIHGFGVDGRSHPVATTYFSGDMGLRFGMGTRVAPALADQGVPVVGIASPTLFNRHRSQADVDRIVSQAIHTTIERTGAQRIVLMGQSFGADILAAGLPSLSAADRAHVAAVVLVVPGTSAYFRADPSGIAYRGTPDAMPADALRNADWAPIICIYGAAEPDSLCPALIGTHVKVIALPGGHFLNNDPDTLIHTIMTALQGIDPDIGPVT